MKGVLGPSKSGADSVLNEADEAREVRLSKNKLAGLGAAGLGVLSAAFIAVSSIASWTDSASVGTQLQAGSFGIEVSVDGGNTWNADTSIDAFADLPNASAIDNWTPDDHTVDDVQIRIPEDATHSAVVSYEMNADADGWAIGLYDEEIGWFAQGPWELEPGDTHPFSVTVGGSEDLQPDAVGDVVITFNAESIPN